MTHTKDPDAGGTLIWERLDRLPRAAQSGLSRARIVEAAMALADAEGIEAVTMRRIAARLDSAAMSLYRHVFSKEDLLDLMLDAGFGEIVLPAAPSGDWRADLRALAVETRRAFQRHAWLAGLLFSRPPLGPNYLRYFEFCLAGVASLGIDIRAMTRIVGLVHVYVTGFIAIEQAEGETTLRTGLSDQDKHRIAAPYVATIIAGGEYPNFARFFAAGPAPDQSGDGFVYGLDCLLDGIAARLPVS